MGKLSALWRLGTSWYISLVLVVAAGLAIGYFVFFGLYPGKPKIAIIDIPFTVFTEDSAFVVSSYLEFARREDDIKGVVINLNSPGSVGTAGERLFLETRKLREEKPVVIAMGDVTASGAYMMSLGANHTYASPGSWVGSIGVFITFPGASIPSTPDERVISTGPQKLTGGGTRRDLLRILDQLKKNFYQMVAAERGKKLRISPEEVLSAKIYNGNEAVRLGLVDSVGGESEAIEKAASLAGVSGYDLVDVNTEVARIFAEKIKRIIEPLVSLGNQTGLTNINTLPTPLGEAGGSSDPLGYATDMKVLRRLFFPSGVSEIQEAAPPGIPMDINTPRIYYLYVGPTQ